MPDFLSSPRFAALQRSVDDADVGVVVVRNADFGVQWVNDAFCRLVGREPEAIAGVDIRSLGAVEPGALDEVRKVHAGDQLLALIPRQFVRPDGTQVRGRATVHALADGLSLGIFQPMAPAEAEAEALHRLVEQAPVAIVTVDRRGRIALVNAEAERLLRHPPGALIGREVEDLLPAELRAAHRRHREAYAAAPQVRRIGAGRDLRALRGDGTEIMVEASLNPMSDGATQVVLVDVTERKRVERELERRAARERAVASLGERALEGAGIRELEQLACGLVAEHLAVDTCAALEADGLEDALVVRAAVGLGERAVGRATTLSGSEFAGALRAGEAIAIHDASGHPVAESRELMAQVGVRSAGAVLVGARKDMLGVLAVGSRAPRHFTADDLAFLKATANVLADAIRRVRAEAAIRHHALHDPVTGLPNRVLLTERIRHWLDGAARTELQSAVLVVDVDDFKHVNDTLGHHVGDDLLRAIGPRLRAAVRPGDTVARFTAGGFVVFCEDLAGEHDAVLVADRVRAALRRSFQLVGGRRHSITASVGVALSERPPLTVDDMIRNAEIAVHRAKRDGRDRSVVFSQGLRDSVVRRGRMEAGLRDAMAREEIDVHFQPIVTIDERRVVGLEALARWSHPERGPVSPAEFIPLAEGAGLIGALGEQVMRTAARHAAEWNRAGHDVFTSVNLSAKQVTDPATLDLVREILDETGLRPDRLAFEVTETAVLGDTTAACAVIEGLRATGARVKLDDFGTGYSSLSHLRALPFDCLKIDRSFVAEITDDAESRALLETIARMGHIVGADVIAEGVETDEQHELLRRLGCEYAQGWLHGRPMPAGDVARHLERRAGTPRG